MPKCFSLKFPLLCISLLLSLPLPLLLKLILNTISSFKWFFCRSLLHTPVIGNGYMEYDFIHPQKCTLYMCTTIFMNVFVHKWMMTETWTGYIISTSLNEHYVEWKATITTTKNPMTFFYSNKKLTFHFISIRNNNDSDKKNTIS